MDRMVVSEGRVWVREGQTIYGPYEHEEDAKEEAGDARRALPPREEADGALEPDDENQPSQKEEVTCAYV